MITKINIDEYRNELEETYKSRPYSWDTHYKLTVIMRKDLKMRGYVSAAKLCRVKYIGVYASDLKRLAKKNEIDAIRVDINGTIKWYYRHEEAISMMEKLPAQAVRSTQEV